MGKRIFLLDITFIFLIHALAVVQPMHRHVAEQHAVPMVVTVVRMLAAAANLATLAAMTLQEAVCFVSWMNELR